MGCERAYARSHPKMWGFTPAIPKDPYNICKTINAMELYNLIKQKRERILETAARYGASNVRIFGSVARGQADESSDIDLLVNLEAGRSLMDLGGLLVELREILGTDVDVVTEKGLRSRIREQVIKDAVPL